MAGLCLQVWIVLCVWAGRAVPVLLTIGEITEWPVRICEHGTVIRVQGGMAVPVLPKAVGIAGWSVCTCTCGDGAVFRVQDLPLCAGPALRLPID
ncbi:hypothetical protein [Nonomuraea fuscirosea]|uniref:hypothetical protein n=1 Tax=Nonomuraea fuscirosea TaxID=1291556 RepID=UPI00343A35B5